MMSFMPPYGMNTGFSLGVKQLTMDTLINHIINLND